MCTSVRNPGPVSFTKLYAMNTDAFNHSVCNSFRVFQIKSFCSAKILNSPEFRKSESQTTMCCCCFSVLCNPFTVSVWKKQLKNYKHFRQKHIIYNNICTAYIHAIFSSVLVSTNLFFAVCVIF